MGQPFAGRGKRTEEAVELMRALWEPGWTEHRGEHYCTSRLEMTPNPQPIRVLFGGLTDLALRRAARYDGWVGDLMATDAAIATVGKLREHRRSIGRATDEFTVLATFTDVFSPDDLARAEAGGITHLLTQAWAYYCKPDASIDAKIDAKIDAMATYRRDLLLDSR